MQIKIDFNMYSMHRKCTSRASDLTCTNTLGTISYSKSYGVNFQSVIH